MRRRVISLWVLAVLLAPTVIGVLLVAALAWRSAETMIQTRFESHMIWLCRIGFSYTIINMFILFIAVVQGDDPLLFLALGITVVFMLEALYGLYHAWMDVPHRGRVSQRFT